MSPECTAAIRPDRQYARRDGEVLALGFDVGFELVFFLTVFLGL
jgi:hypothetical protein